MIIEIIEQHKYLRCILTGNLKLEEHIMYIYEKISTKIYFLNRCSKYLSQKARETIYNTIILPHFYFAGSVLYLCNQSNINKRH